MITQKQFEESLKILSICQETYDTKEAPANVERIIFPRKEFIGDAKILLKYFYQDERAIKRMFAKFIFRICKIWEIDKDDLFYTINQLRQ